MNYSNPMEALMRLGQKQSANPLQQLAQIGTQKQQQQPINPQQFTQAVSKLDKNTLAGLVQQARQRGISEQEIESGLDFLLKLR